MTGQDDDRLSGWKEIASYLHRSVRSVQRWEREMQLPVRRVRTPNGQAIFASRAELDAWMARTQLPPADPLDDHHDEHHQDHHDGQDEAPHDTPTRRPARSWQAVAAVMVIGVVVVALVSAVLWRGGPRNLSSKVTVRGQQIEGWSRIGKRVWTVDLPTDSRRVPIESVTRSAVDSDSHADVRLLPDGNFVHLVPVRASPSGGRAGVTDSLHAITDSGDVLWTWAPEFSLTCGGNLYEGPWRMTSMAVSTGPGEKVIWASYTHHDWWPSVVFEVAAGGASRLRYVQSGWIMSLAEVTTSHGHRLLAGGVLNDLAQPSLAFLDLSRDEVALYDPANDAFDCAVESAGRPSRVVAMPTSETTLGEGSPYSIVRTVWRQPDSLFAAYNKGDMTVTLNLNEEVTGIAFTDLYWESHRRMSDARVITHEPALCPWLRAPAEIREWTPETGWTTYGVPVDERSRPPAK